MAIPFSTLASEIPWTEKPGGLQSTGSQRTRHDLANKQQQQNIPALKGFKELYDFRF